MKIFLLLTIFFSLSNVFNAQYFKVVENKLFDANNQEFIMRGVNIQQMEWDYMIWNSSNNQMHYMDYAFDSLRTIANTGFNSVRMLWRKDNGPGQAYNLPGMDSARLEKTIQEAIKWKLVPILELHDYSGSNDPEKLQSCAQWWVSNMALFKKYERYMMINIANEWGGWEIFNNNQIWRDAYVRAIQTIRNAGWYSTLMVDAPTWGQNAGAILQFGQDIINNDPAKNILFSLHSYGEKNQLTQIGNINWSNYNLLFWYIKFVYKLPFVVGEFGLCDHNELMKEAMFKEVGYLPWAWCGGWGEDGVKLNICAGSPQFKETWTSGALSSPLGTDIVNGPYGIKNTAKVASIFYW